MIIARPTPEQAPYALRALYTVAASDGDLDPRELQLIELGIRVLKADIKIEDLTTITPEEVAEAIPEQPVRGAMLQRMVLISMMDEKIDPAEIETLKAFAKALGVKEKAIKNMKQVMDGHIKRMSFDLGRRSFVRQVLRKVWKEEGLKGFWKIAKVAMGRVDAKMGARSAALGELPEGTLGRAYFDFMRRNEFALPGEKHGPPDFLLFHDIGHVLGGFPTTPSGEVQIAGLQAGYMGEDGFTMTLFIMLLFHMGQNIRPGVEATTGMFDLDAFRASYTSGKGMNVNLVKWDPWPHM
jgi:tellurite resistance protein